MSNLDFWDITTLNLWWKRKIRNLGFKTRPIYGRQDECDICGKYDEVFPAHNFVVCQSCAKKMNRIRQATRKIAWGTKDRCIFCGRQDIIMWTVIFAKVCLKCLWRRLGKQKRAMKVDGSKFF